MSNVPAIAEKCRLDRKMAAILLILRSTNGGPVTDRYIIAVVWGDNPPPCVSKSIHPYMSKIRSAAGIGIRHYPKDAMWQICPDLDQPWKLPGV
jgi:hypothetical protein